jgi:hypothetical protein
MAIYRKKPVLIEAIQFDGTEENAVELINHFHHDIGVITDHEGKITNLTIPTLEGVMTANKNDYIIKGVKGEIYPCKSNIFDLTYEIVKEETNG